MRIFGKAAAYPVYAADPILPDPLPRAQLLRAAAIVQMLCPFACRMGAGTNQMMRRTPT